MLLILSPESYKIWLKQNISQNRFYQNGTCFRSNHHQVYTDLKVIGKCNDIKLPSQYLWDNTSLQKKFFLFFYWHYNPWWIVSLFHNYPLLFSVLRLTFPIPYTCKSLFMLGCLCCFHLVSSFRRFTRYIFIMGWGCQPLTQPPTWRSGVSNLVWAIILTCLAWEALPVGTLLPA